MGFWEQFVIGNLKVLLAALHVDPSKAAGLKKVLLSIANDIYTFYDITVPPQV